MSYAFCATTFFVSEETLPDHLVYCVETRILVCVFQVQSSTYFISDLSSLKFAKQETLLCLADRKSVV